MASVGLLAACTSVTLAGCDEKLSSITGPTPTLQPTFSSIQSLIFDASDSSGRAACVACHAPGGISVGVLNLRSDVSYNNLINRSSRLKPGAVLVVPGDPDNSYLIRKLEGRSDISGGRMPLSGPPYLTDGQVLVIRRWIQTGANNN